MRDASENSSEPQTASDGYSYPQLLDICLFGLRETVTVAGMRALITCAECDTPLACINTVDEHATIETDIESCLEHPGAANVVTVERL